MFKTKKQQRLEAFRALVGSRVTCGSCDLWLNGCKKRFDVFGRERWSFPKEICLKYTPDSTGKAYQRAIDHRVKELQDLMSRGRYGQER